MRRRGDEGKGKEGVERGGEGREGVSPLPRKKRKVGAYARCSS